MHGGATREQALFFMSPTIRPRRGPLSTTPPVGAQRTENEENDLGGNGHQIACYSWISTICWNVGRLTQGIGGTGSALKDSC